MGRAIPRNKKASIEPSRHHIIRMSQPEATPRATSVRGGQAIDSDWLAAIAELVRAPRAKMEITIASTATDRKSTRLNSSHANISYAVFCLKKKDRLTP